ncbi:hypothetical protein ACJMK2_032755 [Sinanodonta woodiana]|uniref:asparagine--tRNA ligase n=1 Tax=Sinanodonta woodiana TaxID=1069815 RepID=A0ABD3X2N9_SINWO
MAAPMRMLKHLPTYIHQLILHSQRCLTFSKYSTIRQSIKDILDRGSVGKFGAIEAQGWVKSARDQKHIVFLHINDGSTLKNLQVVLDPAQISSNVNFGSCVSVKGELVPSPAKGQPVELKASEITVLGQCDVLEYPVKKVLKQDPDYLRSIPHLRPRTDFIMSLLRIRNAASMAIHSFFQKDDFLFIHTPILTSNDCEGAGEVFKVESEKLITAEGETCSDENLDKKQYFGHPTYLTVSGQLHLEVMMGAFRKVYSFGPTFRADSSIGRHHLSEFYMIEAEMAFTRDLEDIINVMENLVKHATKEILQTSEEDVRYFLKNYSPQNQQNIISNLTDKQFLRIPYTEAVDILEKKNSDFQFKISWGCDFQKEHEKYLVKYCDNIPVFVTDFPKELKPFYARVNKDDKTVSAVDLLLPEVGELTGGSLREDRFDILEDRLNSLKLVELYSWYLDLRRYGSVPHGGFGMGFERYLQSLLGIKNIRDTIPFPRSLRNCKL